jgi:hypothetical protein
LSLSVSHRDVEVGDLAIVEYIACWQLIEGLLVVEDLALKVVDAVLVSLGGDAGGGLLVGDGLEETIGDTPKKHHINVRL